MCIRDFGILELYGVSHVWSWIASFFGSDTDCIIFLCNNSINVDSISFTSDGEAVETYYLLYTTLQEMLS